MKELKVSKANFPFVYKFFPIFLLSIFTIACSQRPLSNQSLIDVVSYPDPPDTARIQYLTSYSSSSQFEKKTKAFKKYLIGEEAPKGIIKPYGATFHDNRIYICDLDLPGLEIMNLKNEKFEYFVPRGLGKLQLPINCSLDSAGALYVADVKREQIVVFNKNLEYVTSFGRTEKFKPTDVVVTEEKVWVCNIINGTVDVFKKDSLHTFLFSIPEKNDKKANLLQPTNLYVTNDKVYVSDFGDFKIKIFDHLGNLISTVGSYGKNIGQFVRPKGIAVDKEENLFVVDAAFENVQIFNKDGQLLMFFGGTYNGPGGMLLPAKVAISYDDNEFFQKFVYQGYTLKYIIMVTNNFGPDRVSIYGNIEVKNKTKN